MIKRELELFFTALMFFTRIPCPKVPYSQEHLDASSRYYPVIGWIVGMFAAVVFYKAHLALPVSVSIILSMITTIFLTGAFHEDGFGDTCDGFGGGWSKEQVLAIMKDSRIGAYGTIGLIMILLTKFVLLSEINTRYLPLVLIAAHSVSRAVSSLFRYTHDYVQDIDQSKVRPMAKKLTLKNLLIVLGFGIAPLFLFNNFYVFALLAPVVAAEMLLAQYFAGRIGGYTGDCLGALQQVCEVIFYLGFIVLWKFI